MNLTSLVKIFAVSGFALICSSAYAEQGVPYSAIGNTQYFDESGTLRGGISNLFSSMSGTLSEEDQRRHTQTVLMALNMAEAGETAEWYNPRNNSSGLVQVVASTNTGVGFCRIFLSKVNKNGDIRLYKETACAQQDRRGWTFYK